MNRNLIVVDDFYPNFEAVRSRALTAKYPAPYKGFTYPGRNSDERFVPAGVLETFSKLTGSPLFFEPRLSTGMFRRSFIDDPMEQYVHIDGADWSAVVYLNTPAQCREFEDCGTILWRHKESGLDIVPWARVRNDDARQIVERDSFRIDRWEKVIQIPMKANRLVLFRGNHWHSHAKNFGSDIHDCRLVHLYFFDEGVQEIRI